MNKARFSTSLLIFVTWLAGCDKANEVSVDSSPVVEPAKEIKAAPVPTQPLQPIDLSLPDDTIETPAQNKFLEPAEETGTEVASPGKKKKLNVSGKLHIDKEQEDYTEAVEGAEINIEVKFD